MAGIYVEGLGELAAALGKESALVKKRATDAVNKTAKKVENTARQLAPLGPTGELRRSIETTSTGAARAEVGPTVRYGAFVEFGTYKDSPQPYMGPAVDQHGGDLVDEIENLIGEL